MGVPKVNRTVKRTIDLVHLFAASIWLGGFAVLFVLTLNNGAALGLVGLDTLAFYRCISFAIHCAVYPLPHGNSGAVWHFDLVGLRQAWLADSKVDFECCGYCGVYSAATFNSNGGGDVCVRYRALCPFCI